MSLSEFRGKFVASVFLNLGKRHPEKKKTGKKQQNRKYKRKRKRKQG